MTLISVSEIQDVRTVNYILRRMTQQMMPAIGGQLYCSRCVLLEMWW
jgi:hypothetical protein